MAVENACGSDDGALVVEVTCDQPAATFTSNSPVTLGEMMTFTSTVTGTPPIGYTWQFGDGAVAIGPGLAVVTYTYEFAGSYTVTLTVENPCGIDGDSRQVVVEPVWRYVFLPLIQK